MKLFYIEDKYILIYRFVIVLVLTITISLSILGGIFELQSGQVYYQAQIKLKKKIMNFKNLIKINF